MVTTYDLAEKAGVSQATVSRVLNGSPAVSAETKQLVMEWVRKLDYQPNHAARSLSKKQSSLLGMVIPDVMNPYFSEVLKAVEQAADLNGYNLVLCDSRGNLQKEKQCLNVLRRHQVAGILLVPIDKEKSPLNIPKDWRMSGNMPVVVITQELDALDYVCVSHTRGGGLVANHFLEGGHTNIAFLGVATDEKLSGFRATLASRGVLLPDERLILLEDYHGWQGFHEVHRRLNEYLERHRPLDVTALFAYNDLAAFSAAGILQAHGYRIPEDIVIAGFDNTFLANEMKPQLTSVAQPIAEMASLAVNLLFEKMAGIKTSALSHLVLEPTLVVRESTRRKSEA